MSKFIKIIFLVILNLSLLFSFSTKASEKIKIGLMVPLTGSNKELGQSIIKAVRLAVRDINNNSIEIIPKDTASKPNKALKSAFELKQMGVKVVIGYAEINTNRVTLPVETESYDKIENVSFNANLFRDVLVANKECESATLEVSSQGLARINFKIDEYDATYYLVADTDV